MLLIITDLDGSLLDHHTYSFEAASSALSIIKERRIPLIICSSKTRAEIEIYRDRLGNSDPFISENGGAIFIPEKYPGLRFKPDRTKAGYQVIELGTEIEILKTAFREIKKRTGRELIGLSEMEASEISALTGLTEEEAQRAKEREYSEPFIIRGGGNPAEVLNEIKAVGLRWTQGGRFFHLMGNSDKGEATRRLINVFKESCPGIETIAIGDSLNDLPMLREVSQPVIVRRPDGEYDKRIKLPGLIYANGIGPVGWNEAVSGLMSNR